MQCSQQTTLEVQGNDEWLSVTKCVTHYPSFSGFFEFQSGTSVIYWLNTQSPQNKNKMVKVYTLWQACTKRYFVERLDFGCLLPSQHYTT